MFRLIRLFLRLIGLVLLAGAFAALVVDGTRSVAAGSLAILPLRTTAEDLFPNAYPALEKQLAAHAGSLWQPVILPVLNMPAWLPLGVLGLLLLLITRRRPAKIGYSRR